MGQALRKRQKPSRSTHSIIAVTIPHSHPATHIEKLSRYIDTLAAQEADLNSLSSRWEKSLSQAIHHISWITKAETKRHWESGQMWMTASSRYSKERDFLFSVRSVVIVNTGGSNQKNTHRVKTFLKKIGVMTWDDARQSELTCQTAFRLPEH